MADGRMAPAPGSGLRCGSMRTDPSEPGTPPAKALPWDNEELRKRLKGRQAELTGLSELHDLARVRAEEPKDDRRRGRKSRWRRRDS